jgi:hypothetical protein
LFKKKQWIPHYSIMLLQMRRLNSGRVGNVPKVPHLMSDRAEIRLAPSTALHCAVSGHLPNSYPSGTSIGRGEWSLLAPVGRGSRRLGRLPQCQGLLLKSAWLGFTTLGKSLNLQLLSRVAMRIKQDNVF